MSGTDRADLPEETELPEWDDDYLDEVARRLVFNYDIERDFDAAGEQFDLYGRMDLTSRKHFLHPSISFAEHESTEHLFARRAPSVGVADLERLVAVGHDLADGWIEANEEHYSTDFTFVAVVPEVTDEVRSFVDGFRDRTLLKYGFNGHYEVNLLVVAPEREELVASQEASVAEAFATWERIEREEPGFLDLVRRRLQL